ncbi:MAG: asparagine synthase C-terminal domain-containing protein, partial [Gemmatimonadetes bacterium]|nr:asparagine synthase C-terminal domain-containing protein [Gemmatimonadota bacterium]
PLLDRAVVEAAATLPDPWRVSLLRGGKPLLKRLTARHVPRKVVYRRKRGFDLPVDAWLDGPFRERFEDRLSARAVDGLDYGILGDVYGRHRKGERGNLTALLWAWLCLEEWHSRWAAGGELPTPPGTWSGAAGFLG